MNDQPLNECTPATAGTATEAKHKRRPQTTHLSDRLQQKANGELPQFLRDLLSCPPRHGDGVHTWLFKTARQLHAHRDIETICNLLAAAVDGCGRHVPASEIKSAVENASECAWRPAGSQGANRPGRSAPKWPPQNRGRISEILSDRFGLADLWHASPMRCTHDSTDAEFFVDALFPGNPLLCIGRTNSDFKTAPREDFRGKLNQMTLIVPSPMSALLGKKQNPKPGENPLSAHTLDNTGARHFLVTEFDQGSHDEQSAILWHLKNFAPLVMVLSSGGKSLHGWWNCRHADPAILIRFMRYAVSLGADTATWTPCQFVRLPQGWRGNKSARQSVFYFNHKNAEEGHQAND